MKIKRRLTIIESPYGDGKGGVRDDALPYLRRCLRDSWERGELPFASHAFFPFFLHESDPEERKAGIEAGYEFWDFADSHPGNRPGALRPVIAFYVDLGMSPGMTAALARANAHRLEISIRTLPASATEEPAPSAPVVNLKTLAQAATFNPRSIHNLLAFLHTAKGGYKYTSASRCCLATYLEVSLGCKDVSVGPEIWSYKTPTGVSVRETIPLAFQYINSGYFHPLLQAKKTLKEAKMPFAAHTFPAALARAQYCLEHKLTQEDDL